MEDMRGVVRKCGKKIARNGQPFTWFILAADDYETGTYLIAYEPRSAGTRRMVEGARGRYLIRQGSWVRVLFRPARGPGLPGHAVQVTPWKEGAAQTEEIGERTFIAVERPVLPAGPPPF